MGYQISVDKAIRRGHWVVSAPSVLLVFGGIFLTFWFIDLAYSWSSQYAIALVLAAPLMGGAIGFIYRSIAITRWRLWAFARVRNVHELHRKAVRTQLLSEEGSFFERTELRLGKDRARWQALKDKFYTPDEVVDDGSIPKETVVYKSKRVMAFITATGVLFVGYFAYLVFAGSEPVSIWALVPVLLGGTLVWVGLSGALKRIPQITLNEQGMSTAISPFYPWSAIHNEQIKTEMTGRYKVEYLSFVSPKGSVRLNVNGFDASPDMLDRLLVVYRHRYEKKMARFR